MARSATGREPSLSAMELNHAATGNVIVSAAAFRHCRSGVGTERRGDHDHRRKARRRDQEGRKGRADDVHGLFGLRFQDRVGPDRVDRERPAVPGRDLRRQAPVRLAETSIRRTKATCRSGTSASLWPTCRRCMPFERSFWSRFDAGFDFGYSMTQANSAKQLTLGGTLSYRDEQVVDTASGNVFKSSQSNAPETQRWDLGNDFRYLLGDALVRQHHPGLPEQRRAGARSPDHDWRGRRAVPAALGVAVSGVRRRARLDE